MLLIPRLCFPANLFPSPARLATLILSLSSPANQLASCAISVLGQPCSALCCPSHLQWTLEAGGVFPDPQRHIHALSSWLGWRLDPLTASSLTAPSSLPPRPLHRPDTAVFSSPPRFLTVSSSSPLPFTASSPPPRPRCPICAPGRRRVPLCVALSCLF